MAMQASRLDVIVFSVATHPEYVRTDSANCPTTVANFLAPLAQKWCKFWVSESDRLRCRSGTSFGCQKWTPSDAEVAPILGVRN